MKRRGQKAAAAKKRTYVVIERDSAVGAPIYARLEQILHRHHEELTRACARIVLAWATNWHSDVDGRLVLGKCKRASELDRELAPFDFVILLNRDFWQSPRVTDIARDALLDHELMHAAVAYDEQGEPKVDETGRAMFRTRRHDIEEFRDIVARHGCYKADLEEFFRAFTRVSQQTAGAWVGYTTLHEQLKAIGVAVPAEEIRTWTDAERREVHTWALMRQDSESRTVGVIASDSMPPCLRAAVESATPTAH